MKQTGAVKEQRGHGQIGSCGSASAELGSIRYLNGYGFLLLSQDQWGWVLWMSVNCAIPSPLSSIEIYSGDGIKPVKQRHISILYE